jgi:hypothetical protein
VAARGTGIRPGGVGQVEQFRAALAAERDRFRRVRSGQAAGEVRAGTALGKHRAQRTEVQVVLCRQQLDGIALEVGTHHCPF